jgi:hypothetical protein
VGSLPRGPSWCTQGLATLQCILYELISDAGVVLICCSKIVVLICADSSSLGILVLALCCAGLRVTLVGSIPRVVGLPGREDGPLPSCKDSATMQPAGCWVVCCTAMPRSCPMYCRHVAPSLCQFCLDSVCVHVDATPCNPGMPVRWHIQGVCLQYCLLYCLRIT